MSRRNGLYFTITQLLMYFSAPVIYVRVVQAAFCDRLGANATVANLPSSTYLLGSFVPIVCAWMFSARLERAVVQGAFAIVAFSMLFVCLVVFLPCPDWVRISVVIGPGLIIGIINAITNVYMFKCLSRGATEKGRARALKFAFGLGPIAAMLGSLGAQALLEGRLAALQYPFNFGVLYLIALPCMVVCSFLSSRYKLISVPDEPRSLFFRYLAESFRGYYRDRTLVLAWLSAPAVTTRNLAFLSLATPVASVAPAIYGGLTDHIGFKASFGFGGVMTVLALVFISAIPRAKGRWRRPRPKQPASP